MGSFRYYLIYKKERSLCQYGNFIILQNYLNFLFYSTIRVIFMKIKYFSKLEGLFNLNFPSRLMKAFGLIGEEAKK